MRKLMATAVAVIALSVPLISATTANAADGGYYASQGLCDRAGKQIVENPNGVYNSWSCTKTTHSPPYHLVLNK